MGPVVGAELAQTRLMGQLKTSAGLIRVLANSVWNANLSDDVFYQLPFGGDETQGGNPVYVERWNFFFPMTSRTARIPPAIEIPALPGLLITTTCYLLHPGDQCVYRIPPCMIIPYHNLFGTQRSRQLQEQLMLMQIQGIPVRFEHISNQMPPVPKPIQNNQIL